MKVRLLFVAWFFSLLTAYAGENGSTSEKYAGESIRGSEQASVANQQEPQTKTEVALPSVSDFLTLESAVAEIKRLNDEIAGIESSYETKSAQTREEIYSRYAMKLADVDALQKDEFETVADFNAKKQEQRDKLTRQKDAELVSATATEMATKETSPLRRNIQQLANREYILGVESLSAELGSYNIEEQYFPISFGSKIANVPLLLNGSIPLMVTDAKNFKQQWLAGLIRPEGKVKAGNNQIEIVLINDASNERLINVDGLFVTQQQKRERELARQEIQEQVYRGEMVKIPGQKFEIGKTEVTRSQWFAVFDKTSDSSAAIDEVSWNDVQVYLQKLNAKTGKQYRLPTKEEWLFSCYGGHETKYCGGDDANSLGWFAEGNVMMFVNAVGLKQANGYGLYDMSGNALEWLSQCDQKDCSVHLAAGGSIGTRITPANLFVRADNDFRERSFGFRLARTIP